MRIPFPLQKRVPSPVRPEDAKKVFLDPPPELPRTIPVKAWRKALPYIIGAAMVGMLVLMLMNGFRQVNPMYLIMMVVMVLSLVQSVRVQGGTAEMTTEEVDSERSEYLRYLSLKAAKIRAAGDQQRRSAEWSHPDPDVLEAAVGSGRMWERSSKDPDCLKIRVGRTAVKLDIPITKKGVDSELDREPVTKTAVTNMIAVQQSIPHCPKAIDLVGAGRIDVYGDRDLFRAAVRAWIGQLACWHSPNAVAVAVASPELETAWGSVKWLPHTETGDIDGAGPARYLAATLDEIDAMLEPLIRDRADLSVSADGPSRAHKHLFIVVDGDGSAGRVAGRLAGRDGVTVVVYRGQGEPAHDFIGPDRTLTLLLDRCQAGAPMMREWEGLRWTNFCAEPDLMDAGVSRNLARLLSQWDPGASVRRNTESQAVQGLLDLLGIDNAAALDVAALWADRPLAEQLRVPAALQPNGAPLWFDLKDNADGGMGPHGLLIAYTGAGKSKLLATIVFCLLTMNSPDVVRALLGDFKDEAGFDQFAGYPGCVGVVSNMAEKKNEAERLGDTLLGILDTRGRIFKEWGRRIKGSAFEKLSEYNAARVHHPEMPVMPTLFVIIDEFSLLLDEHPHMAKVFEVVTRKGRSYGMFFLFASQTLDEGKVGKIVENTNYRIGMKVTSDAISRRVIGTGEAFHIPDTPNAKGTLFFVRAPGAEPVKGRSFMLPEIYQPPVTVNRRVTKSVVRPRLFTAARVEPDPDMVIEEIVTGPSVLEGPPRSLALTVGPQLAAYWGRPPVRLFSPPLDEPIPLDRILDEAAAAGPDTPGTVPWWPLGELDQPRALRHGLLNYSIEQGNVSIMGANPGELSMVATTFVLAAAARYTPQQVGFFALSYGGAQIAAIKDLPHVAAVGGRDRRQMTARIFSDLHRVMAGRRRIFRDHDISSMTDYRRRRAAGEAGLDDGYPVDVFLIVDGWESFLEDNTSLMHPKNPETKQVEALTGSDHGLHLLVTSADTIKLGTILQGRLTCSYELKMANTATSMIKARIEPGIQRPQDALRPQDRIPADQLGRGLTRSAEVIRFAVGRLDGQPVMTDLDDRVRETVAEISGRYPGVAPVPRPRPLPAVVAASELEIPGLAGEQFVLGLRGSDLAPLVIDFARDPLLACYGESKSGRTALLDNLVRQIVDRRGGDVSRSTVAVFDARGELAGATRWLVQGEDYYEQSTTAMNSLLEKLMVRLGQRIMPDGLSWEQQSSWRFDGPLIYLIIDNIDAITEQGPGFQALIRHLGHAKQRGLRVFFTHASAGAMAAESVPGIPAKFAKLPTNRILLSGRSAERVGGYKFEEGLPPGRGYLLAAHPDNEGHLQLMAPAHEVAGV